MESLEVQIAAKALLNRYGDDARPFASRRLHELRREGAAHSSAYFEQVVRALTEFDGR